MDWQFKKLTLPGCKGVEAWDCCPREGVLLFPCASILFSDLGTWCVLQSSPSFHFHCSLSIVPFLLSPVRCLISACVYECLETPYCLCNVYNLHVGWTNDLDLFPHLQSPRCFVNQGPLDMSFNGNINYNKRLATVNLNKSSASSLSPKVLLPMANLVLICRTTTLTSSFIISLTGRTLRTLEELIRHRSQEYWAWWN